MADPPPVTVNVDHYFGYVGSTFGPVQSIKMIVDQHFEFEPKAPLCEEKWLTMLKRIGFSV